MANKLRVRETTCTDDPGSVVSCIAIRLHASWTPETSAILSLEIPLNLSDIIAMKTILFTTASAKQFDRLPTVAQGAVEKALTTYAITGEGDVKKLSGRDGYRMRVGEYRIIFDEDQTTILAIHIARRTSTTY